VLAAVLFAPLMDWIAPNTEVGRMPYAWPKDTDFTQWELDVLNPPHHPDAPGYNRPGAVRPLLDLLRPA
jgi:hypothetical protein